jgi:hypothetical protein
VQNCSDTTFDLLYAGEHSKGGPKMGPKSTDWRQLAKLATTETDSTKLMELVTELNRILGEEEEALYKRRIQCHGPAISLLDSLAVLPSALPVPPTKGGFYGSY